MLKIKDLSIKRKLLFIILLINFITIGAGFSFIIFNNYKSNKAHLVKEHQLDAKLIGDYCIAPLTFEDHRGAAEILSKLESKPDILSGILYDNNKNIFATYNHSDNDVVLPKSVPSQADYIFSENELTIWEPATYNNEIYGYVYLKASNRVIKSDLTQQILFSVLLLFILLSLAYLFGNQLQRIISTPILKLASTADKISRSKDYSIRTKKIANDEIGNLYDSFNEMLERIYVQEKQLIAAKNKAEESDRLKSAFLANMSHEIRTPMNGIMGFAELLKMRDLQGEKQQEYIDVIQKSGKRMLNIINDLIDISKIEAGQMQVYRSVTNINQLLDDLYVFFLPEARSKGLKLLLHKGLNNPDSDILTDNPKLTQVLTNLIKNAIKYTNYGHVTFGYEAMNDTLRFYVEDTGIGIKETLQEQIFERFRQAEMDFSGEYEGAGLGLSISKAFVEMLDGKIWLTSVPNKGSTFYFTLPYVSNQPADDGNNNNNLQSNNLPALSKILIAEDDEISFILIQEIFKDHKVEIVKASNGNEAVNLINAINDIDVVLMDVKMPVMNGLEATKVIKSKKPELPVIAITAFALEGDSQKAMDAGCDGYLPKPVKKDQLMEVIHKVMTTKQKA